MAHALSQHPDVDVTWLFSGRPRARLFDMEPFGDFQHRAGLIFVTEAGRLRYRKTIMANRYWQFIRDMKRLYVKAYDLVVTDYEPVTAWAGKSRIGGRTLCCPAYRNVFTRTHGAWCWAALVQLWR